VWERVGREKLLLYVAVFFLGCARSPPLTAGREGRGHIVAAARLQLVNKVKQNYTKVV